jgi:hypothetical protein
MARIIERTFVTTSIVEVDTAPGLEQATAQGIAALVRCLLAAGASALQESGQRTELRIQVSTTGRQMQVGGQLLVRWIVAQRNGTLA